MNEKLSSTTFKFALFLLGVFVFPSVLFEAAFDEHGPAFFHVLAEMTSAWFSPNVHVHKSDLFLAFAAFAFPGAVDGQVMRATAVPLGV
jgi:hypothetical protein